MASVKMSGAVIRERGVLESGGFLSCAMFLVKNMRTGEVLMMHNMSDDPEQAEPCFDCKGISVEQAKKLKIFLSSEGRKKAIGLYIQQAERHVISGEPIQSHVTQISELLRSRSVDVSLHEVSLPDGHESWRGLPEFAVRFQIEEDDLQVDVGGDSTADKDCMTKRYSYRMSPFSHSNVQRIIPGSRRVSEWYR